MSGKIKERIRILTRPEIHLLLAATGQRGPSGIRNRALIGVMAGAGLRVSEALALQSHHVDLDRARIDVRCGKGTNAIGHKKSRYAGIMEDAMGLITHWTDERARLGIPEDAPFFCTITKGHFGRMQTAYVRALLSRISAKASLPHVHPHLLRHTHAVGLYRSPEVDLLTISQQLGHASIATTQIYLQGLDESEAADKVAAIGGWAD